MPEGSVHVVDDDAAVRDSLAFLLKSVRLSVRTYDSGTVFLETLPTLKSGCVISDIRMPGLSGIDLLKRVRETNVHLPVIIITGHGDVPLAVEAMKLGAAEFFEKPFQDDQMIAAVRNALEDAKSVTEGDRHKQELQQRLALLSKRESDVLRGLIAGSPNKVIAFDLQISPRTVEIYRANVMTKMNAASLSELVRMAIIAGIA